MLFDSFEVYDVQETRRISREEGHKEGREERLVEQICKKIAIHKLMKYNTRSRRCLV